jgi:hypothetical protein
MNPGVSPSLFTFPLPRAVCRFGVAVYMPLLALVKLSYRRIPDKMTVENSDSETAGGEAD